MWSKKYVTDDEIIEAAEDSKTMSEAASKVNLKFSTFKRRAKSLNVYIPNQGGYNISRPNTNSRSIKKLRKILQGHYPEYQTYKLKLWLFDEGIKSDVCEICGISQWMGKKIKCELHHIDGNSNNHILENLQILCPNCHSQIDSFKNVKSKIKKNRKYGDRSQYTKKVKTDWEKSQEHYVKKILESNIDFSKVGWVKEVSLIINQKPQKVNIWMKRMMPNFYKTCFKRK
jgi:hypothetical protein